MRKLLLAVSVVLVLASFTNNPNETTILKDIDGTLLQSFVSVKKINGEYTATFTVDAMTVVTTTKDVNGTHINLIESGTSGTTVTHTITYATAKLGFNSYFESNFDLASAEGMFRPRVTNNKPVLVNE